MFYMYVLKSNSSPPFYIGHTADLKKRFIEHNRGKTSSTKRGIPWKLIYYEAFLSLQNAKDRELKLKQRGRAWQELKKRIDSA
jgi:putative endonuclease